MDIQKEIKPTQPEQPAWPPREVEPVPETAETSYAPAEQESPRVSSAVPPVLEPDTSPTWESQARTAMEQEIDSILEEDLQELFWNLPVAEQQEFKRQGELTASKIKELLSQAVVRAQEILKLIADWLKLLPGVNNFFVEQEAKIKADKIMKLKR